jgi:formate--tetrahydrofolate ligase
MATRTALKLADYVVTEAGFGADLGAEKFVNIKCRKAGLKPSAAVIVATVRAIKYHGGVEVPDLGKENLAALQKGIANLDRHIDNVRDVFGLLSPVAINHRAEDSEAELQWLTERGTHHGVKAIVARHYAEGGRVRSMSRRKSWAVREPELLLFLHDDNMTLWEKMKTVAVRIYGASEIVAAQGPRATKQLQDSATDITRSASPRRSILLDRSAPAWRAERSRRQHPQVRLSAGANSSS